MNLSLLVWSMQVERRRTMSTGMSAARTMAVNAVEEHSRENVEPVVVEVADRRQLPRRVVASEAPPLDLVGR